MNKVAIVLQAGPGTHESHARMFHSMVYSKELKERGHEVRLIFDGAGTEWLAKWGEPQDEDDRRMGGLFNVLRDMEIAYAVCDFCAGVFGVHQSLKAQNEPLVGEYMNHPSFATLFEEGFEVVVL